MAKITNKELKDQYKYRPVVGGVYCIRCNGNDRTWLKSTKDLAGQKNKFEFFVSTKFCPEPGMRAEWNQYGAEAFSFQVLEEITKKETQTDQEFTEDIRILYEIWDLKLQE
jgi:hypothetical protein